MGWITAALGAITAIFKWLTGRDQASSQKDKDHAEQAVAGISEIQKADAARDRVDQHLHDDPGSVRKPDADTAPRGSDSIS